MSAPSAAAGRLAAMPPAASDSDSDSDSDRVVAWVYLLRCLADDSLYTGWTVDLDRRLAAHQAGSGSRYTRSRLPVELAAALPMPDAASARREEARIKRLTRSQKLSLIATAD
jgi:putative endonuclease